MLMKRLVAILILSFAWAWSPAQEYSHVAERNAWNGSVNAAGLAVDSLSISYAEAYGTKSNGGFVAPSASDDSWNAGVRTESIRHFDKISFTGMFAYDYFEGRNMCGSMFVEPGYYPVDILEYTPGRKIRETYSFRGGLSARLGGAVRGGLLFDFDARNYAKRKNLRHSNTRLDFEAAPSLMFRRGKLAVGLSYIIATDSESLSAEVIGEKGELYYAFFDKGLLFGSEELWTGSGIHLSEAGVSGFPVRSFRQGAALQFSYGAFYIDAEYRYGTGRTGEKDVVWHRFTTHEVKGRAVVTLLAPRYEHYIRAWASWRDTGNRESILFKETENNVTLMHEYGSTAIFARRSLDVRLEYMIYAPRFEFRAGADYTHAASLSTLMFPRSYVETVDAWRFDAAARVTFRRVDLRAGVCYAFGSTVEREHLFDTDMTVSDYPVRQRTYYDLSREWADARRLGANLSVRCRIARGFYIEARGQYLHGFGLRHTAGADWGAATLAAGYEF